MSLFVHEQMEGGHLVSLPISQLGSRLAARRAMFRSLVDIRVKEIHSQCFTDFGAPMHREGVRREEGAIASRCLLLMARAMEVVSWAGWQGLQPLL